MTVKKQEKPFEQNYALLKLEYSKYLIFPSNLIPNINEVFQNAELMIQRYDAPEKIQGIEESDIEISFMSAQRYKEIRLDSLLNSKDDV